MKQDLNGFMWFATNRGIAKFDGYRFKVFSYKDGLPNNDVWRLTIDAKGRVWYFSKSKYQGFIQNDSIFKFETEDGKAISPVMYHKTDKGIIYCGRNMSHVKDGTLKILNSSSSIKEFRRKTSIKDVNIDIWPRSSGLHIVTFSNQTLKIFNAQHQVVFEKKIDEYIDSTLASPFNLRPNSVTNNVYSLVFSKGILLLNLKTKKVNFQEFEKNMNSSVQIYHTDHVGNFQFSVGEVLLIFDQKNLKLVKSIYTENTIKSFQDIDGNIWSTDLSSGISFKSNLQTDTSVFLKGEKVEALGFGNNQLFAGVYNKGIYSFDKELIINRNAWGQAYFIKVPQGFNRTFFIFSNGYYSYENDSIRKMNLGLKNAANIYFKDIVKLNNSIYLCNHSGLSAYDSQSGNLIYIVQDDGVKVLSKYKNRVFAGTSDGLKTLIGKKLSTPKIENPIIHVPVNGFFVSKKYLFVATNGRGVYILSKGGIKHLIETDDLIVNKMVFHKGFLWLATNKGIKKLLLNTNDLRNSKVIDSFNKSDGLLQDNINDILFRDDFIYAATDNGVSKINPYTKIYRKKIKIHFNTKNDTLFLNVEDNKNISISFSALEYSNQKYLSIQFRLLPNQKEWTTTTSRNIDFASLPSGTYALQVKVSDQHGNISVKDLTIQVDAVWWESKLSYLGLVLIICAVFGFIYKSFQSKKLKSIIQEEKIQQNLIKLELQALRTQMNPHFIHNSLNSLHFFILSNNLDECEKYIERFSKLIRFYFDYASVNQITIQEEIDLLTNYIELEKLRFEEKLEYNINLDKRLNLSIETIPTMILQPIVENAINHGLFHSEKKGVLNVNFVYKGKNCYTVSIEDNGIGLEEAKRKNDKLNKKNHSTLVTNERIQLLRQSKEWEIKISSQNLDSTLENVGTIIKIDLKKLNQ